eukprot:scaffold336_cov250-Pinguiococcus_pyrenoidosus.AAC.28
MRIVFSTSSSRVASRRPFDSCVTCKVGATAARTAAVTTSPIASVFSISSTLGEMSTKSSNCPSTSVRSPSSSPASPEVSRNGTDSARSLRRSVWSTARDTWIRGLRPSATRGVSSVT